MDGIKQPAGDSATLRSRRVPAETLRARPADRGPLSYGQQRLWFLDRWLGDSPAYNVPMTLRFTGPLSAERLAAAVTAVAARHDVLFTVFEEVGGEPRQRVLDDRVLSCPIVDLTGSERRAEELIAVEARRPFDLAAGPVLRACLFRLSEREHWLHLTLHHIAGDGWSLDIFQGELLEAYENGGRAVDPSPLQYADFALWQRERLAGPQTERTLGSWADALRSAPAVLDLGTDHPRPAELSYRGRTTTFALPDLSLRGLEEFAAARGVSLYTVLLAGFQALAARHSGGGDIVLGSPVAGRGRAALDAMVGFFADFLVVRTDLADDPTFTELVSRARTSTLDALSRSRVPFDLAVNHLHPERSLGHSPVAQVVFAFHEEEPPAELPGGLTVERFLVPTDTAKFDLTWSVYRRGGELRLEVEYATDLYEPSTVGTLVDHWRTLLVEAVATPDVPVGRLPLMAGPERELVSSSSGGGGAFETGTLHGLVAARAAAEPDAVAVVCGAGKLSYGELNARANAVAHGLRERGVGPEACVGVCAERSIELVVACLAVLKAGGVYVPLDPSFPPERLRAMVQDVRAELVLVDDDARVPDGLGETVGLRALEHGRTDDPPEAAVPGNGCYVIFTSGSTGRPKGTLVTHANATRLFGAVAASGLRGGADDVWTLFHSFGFDFSVWEMWGALTTGGRLVVVPYAVSRDVDAFYELVARESVTVLSQTPSAFRQFEEVDERRGADLALRAVVFGGEALHLPSARRWIARRGERPVLVNMYGITETTVHVTYHEVGAGDLGGAVSRIGRPLPDLRVHVLDPSGEPCPIGVPGEVYVGGAGVTRGYVDRPGLTAARFVPDHLGAVPGARLYRSGDVARWNAAGELEYLGRADSQVKVRGYRIELGEIEAMLGAYPGVREAVVVLHAVNGHDDLVAYVVAGEGDVSAEILREWSRDRLPEYMVPRRWVFLDVLPLTAQGKVDRRALPEPGGERPELAQEFAAPAGVVEELLAEIWAEVLGVDRVGRHDNFFDLGGDSIRSIQVLGQARDAGVGLTLQDLFRTPSVAGLAASAGGSDDMSAAPELEPFALVAPEDRKRLPGGLVDAYPMAELQVGMVYEMELDPDRRPYHNVDSLRISGVFDEGCFREAVARVVERHPVLRTSFDLSGYGEPLQLVHATAEMPFTVVDLRGLGEDAQDTAVSAYVRAERAHRFDHSRPLLLRFGIHRLADDAFQWTITEHHAIFDGWSLHSTISEIGALYQRLLAGDSPVPAPLRSAYRDFIAAERAAIASEDSERFWLDRVADRPDCRLPRWPKDRPSQLTGQAMDDEWRVHNEAEGYGSVETLLPESVCDGLQDLSRSWGVPFKAVVLAVHLRVIGLVTGTSDVLVGLCANGRLEEADAADVRGLFLNTVPFRLQLPDGSWRDLVRAVFEAERELLPHRRYPLSALQRRLGGGALFEVNFVYNHFHVLGKAFGADRIQIVDGKIDSFSTERAEPTNFPLNVGVIRNPYSSRLLLGMDYHTDVLTQDQVLIMRDHYVRIMEAMIADPDGRHRDVSLLGEAERGLLASWNDTAAETPPGLVHDLVAARAAAEPDAVAVVDGERSVSYAELNAWANRLARHLRGAGVGPDVAVGVCVERSAEMVVALLAVLKAGGVYVPLDADFPADRLRYMVEQTGAALVLTAGHRIPEGPWRTVDVGTVELPEDAGELPPLAGPDNGCYVIFTSGSTGRPKGVVTLHRNVTELLHGAEFLRLDQNDTLLHLAPLPFDNSTFEIWAPLAGGARLVMAPVVQYGPADIAEWVARYDVTVLHVTASLFVLLADQEPQLFDGLRRFLTGSETVSPRHVERILERCPGLEVVNCWGPTETTTFSVCGVYAGGSLPAGPLPLGRPLANTEVWVLDDAGLPAPVGTPGELYVAGPCLARGYLGNPAMTAERFGPHPGGGRLYRTGDRGFWSVDGRVEFLGRVDHMIKVRGYRIELGEIEAALDAHPALRESVVVARQDDSGHADLVAYVVTDEGVSAGDLRDWLRERLPKYMVPRRFMFLDALPLTPRAKVDRAALPAPEEERPDLAEAYVPPSGPVEEFLAGAWSRALKLDRVGRHDNFFELGGDSIRSIQVLGQTRSSGLTFSLQDLFRNPTLAELAQVVSVTGTTGERRVHEPFSLVSPEERERLPEGLVDAYPMAASQAGMVYEAELDPERRPYHNVHCLRVSGAFDERCFRAALAYVVERHPILRTSFDLAGYGEPLQLVRATAEIALTVADLRGSGREEQRAVLAEYVRAEQRNVFDLGVAPLCRMAVHLLDGDGFQWTVTEHHAIFDGWSLASTFAEIGGLYRSLLAGRRPVPVPLRSTYRDFVAAERAALESPDSEAFWLDRMVGRPDGRLPRWPADRAAARIGDRVEDERHERDEAQGYGALTTHLRPAMLGRLDGLARRWGVPLKAVVLAVHLRVIGLVTGSSDVLVGLTANGRLEEPDAEEVRGLFLNTVPFRLRLPDGSWHDLVRAVFEAENAQLPHRRYPMAALGKKLGGGALFEVNFVYNHFRQLGESGPGETVSIAPPDADLSAGVARTHFPLVVAVSREPIGGGLALELEYDARELTADQVTALRDYHLRAFEAIVADPDARYREVPLLGEAERGLLASWNDTAAETPPGLVHDLVAARAVAEPDAVAVVQGDRTLTYGELEAWANRLARYLRGLGVGPDVAVGVCVERSVEMVVALLAVMKAGGVYVPLDADLPADRLRYMVEQAGAPLLLTAEATAERVPEGPWRTVEVDSVDLPKDASPLPPVVGSDNGCYVIFTSGSTGRPKGVVTLHRNVTELLHGGDSLALRTDDTVLQIATVAFDVATYEIWAPLAAGARLVLAPPGRYSLADIAEWVTGHGVTVLHATASLFALLVEEEPQLFDGLRRVLTGSETVSPRRVERILERCPGLEVVNCWGPTETTTFSVCGVFTRGTVPAGPLPLGTPLANTEVWVLDDAGLPAPVGTPGELYVAGPCLARGYLNDPVMTAARFRSYPGGGRLYRTGDRGFWSVDGRVEFLGRVDHMVKVRGYRVELGEIEAALDAHPALRDCVVVAREDDSGHADLVAYVVTDEGVSAGDLRDWLRERLPEYMVPRHLMVLASLPLTAQGKVDRRALPEPGEERSDPVREYTAPDGPIEEGLAAIWSQVLEVDRVGAGDDFHTLGGDSILALQVAGRARQAGLRIAVGDLLAGRTIAQLAESVVVEDDETAGSPEPSGAPLTPVQRWFLDLMKPNPDRTDQFVLFEVARPVDEGRLGKAVLALLDTHVMLRSRLVGEGSFEVCPVPENAPVERADLSSVDAELHREHVRRLAWEAARDWRLDRSPQIRFFLVDRGRELPSWILVVTHHLVVDGVSWRVLLDDLATIAAGSPVPPVPTGYPAFAAIVAEYASSPRALAQVPYWQGMHGALSTRLPVELEAGPGDLPSELVTRTRLEKSATAAMLSRAGGHELMPSLLSALACALAGWAPDGELGVMLLRHGRTLAHRPEVDLSRTVGWCTVMHPLSLPVRAGASPGETAARLAERLAEVPDEGLGFGALRWHGGHFPDVAPPDVAFNYVGQDRAAMALGDVARIVRPALDPEPAPGTRRAHPLWVQAAVLDDELVIDWQFSAHRNLPVTVAGVADRFLEILRLLGAAEQTGV